MDERVPCAPALRAAHVFVDETKARGFALTAAAVLPGDLNVARKTIKSFIPGGQPRIHFVRERGGRRKKILDAIEELDPHLTIYDAAGLVGAEAQRQACLKALVGDVVAAGATRIILERDDSVLEFDRRVLFEEVRVQGCTDLQYHHARAREECLLSIPDAIAWCWQRGGHWRKRVASLVDVHVL